MSVFHQYVQNICKVEPLVIKHLQLNRINLSNNLWSYTPGKKNHLRGVIFDKCIIWYMYKIFDKVFSKHKCQLLLKFGNQKGLYELMFCEQAWRPLTKNITDVSLKETWPQPHWGTNGENMRGLWGVEVVTVSYLEGILETLWLEIPLKICEKPPVLPIQGIPITFSFISHLPHPNLKLVLALTGGDADLSDTLRRKWGGPHF